MNVNDGPGKVQSEEQMRMVEKEERRSAENNLHALTHTNKKNFWGNFATFSSISCLMDLIRVASRHNNNRNSITSARDS